MRVSFPRGKAGMEKLTAPLHIVAKLKISTVVPKFLARTGTPVPHLLYLGLLHPQQTNVLINSVKMKLT
jgi:hypothetical protein